MSEGTQTKPLEGAQGKLVSVRYEEPTMLPNESYDMWLENDSPEKVDSSQTLSQITKLLQELKDLILDELLVCHLVRGEVFPVDMKTKSGRKCVGFVPGYLSGKVYETPNFSLFEIHNNRLLAKTNTLLYSNNTWLFRKGENTQPSWLTKLGPSYLERIRSVEFAFTWEDLCRYVEDEPTYLRRKEYEAKWEGDYDFDINRAKGDYRIDVIDWTTDLMELWVRKIRVVAGLDLEHLCLNFQKAYGLDDSYHGLRLLRRCVREDILKMSHHLELVVGNNEDAADMRAYTMMLGERM
ncbi:hypothetical protein MMC25_003844 [Agyrium rufum]|nr:hypothetical protein [Agyrium rufum]